MIKDAGGGGRVGEGEAGFILCMILFEEEKFLFWTMKKTKTPKRPANKRGAKNNFFNFLDFMIAYFTTKKRFLLLVLAVFILGIGMGASFMSLSVREKQPVQAVEKTGYWFVLHRESNVELLYKGVLGDARRSEIIRSFRVKAGIPGERPTPLPQMIGRDYWLVTAKSTSDNPETAPYFITLDVPVSEEPPFGPKPYEECVGGQCDWVLPGAFGLHGVNGDPSRLSDENPGSSGCVRHSDEDITYLYELLNPEKEEIRYYVEDR